jgi:hypothetical protein
MSAKKYIILAERKDTKDYTLSRTNNPSQRIEKLKSGILVANGTRGGRHFDRFDIFKGCDPETDVSFRVFKEVTI